MGPVEPHKQTSTLTYKSPLLLSAKCVLIISIVQDLSKWCNWSKNFWKFNNTSPKSLHYIPSKRHHIISHPSSHHFNTTSHKIINYTISKLHHFNTSHYITSTRSFGVELGAALFLAGADGRISSSDCSALLVFQGLRTEVDGCHGVWSRVADRRGVQQLLEQFRWSGSDAAKCCKLHRMVRLGVEIGEALFGRCWLPWIPLRAALSMVIQHVKRLPFACRAFDCEGIVSWHVLFEML